MTDIRGVPAIPRPDMFIGQNGITPPGYAYLDEMAKVLGEVRSLLSTVEGVTETNTAAITQLQGAEPAPAALKHRYPMDVVGTYQTSGTLFTLQGVTGAAGDIVAFPPLANITDAASWGPPAHTPDGFTTIVGDPINGFDSVHAIDFYMDEQFLFEAMRFTRSGSVYSIALSAGSPFRLGFNHILPDEHPHDYSIRVRGLLNTSTKQFRAIIIGGIDIYEPAAPIQTE